MRVAANGLRWRTRENVARHVPLEPDERVLCWENVGLYGESLLGSPWKYFELAITDRKIIFFEFQMKSFFNQQIVGLKRPEAIIPLVGIEKYWQEESWSEGVNLFIDTPGRQYKFHVTNFVPHTLKEKELNENLLSAIAGAVSSMKEKEKQETEKGRRLEIYEYKYSFADVKLDPQVGTVNIGCPFCHAPKPADSVGNEIRCSHCGKTYLIPPGLLGPSASAEDKSVRFCQGCGSRLGPGSKYCPKCGRSLA